MKLSRLFLVIVQASILLVYLAPVPVRAQDAREAALAAVKRAGGTLVITDALQLKMLFFLPPIQREPFAFDQAFEAIDLTVFRDVTRLNIRAPHMTSRTIIHAQSLPPGLLFLDVAGPVIVRDKDLANLIRKHSDLWHLTIEGTGAGAETAKAIAKLNELETLTLSGLKIDDEAAIQLRPLKKLRTLSLARTSISDNSLPHLAKLSTLERLDLQATDISDDGIILLSRLHSLRDLDVRQTEVTDKGVRALQRSLPNLNISR